MQSLDFRKVSSIRNIGKINIDLRDVIILQYLINSARKFLNDLSPYTPLTMYAERDIS